jgi:hypothetical protein
MQASDTQETTASAVESDEATVIEGLKRDAKAIVKKFEPLSKVKATGADALAQLELALEGLPDGAQLAAAADELKSRARKVLEAGNARRTADFGRIEADFVGERKKAGLEVREVDKGWRVDRFQLELRRERAQGRALYNREVVIPWRHVANRGDLEQIIADASQQLDSHSIVEDALSNVFWEAYEFLRQKKVTSTKGSAAARIPLPEFYREVRVGLVRHELQAASRGDARVRRAEFPKWAFLFNLDRYREFSQKVPDGVRLHFETGSQQDYQNGMGMILNGLNPSQDYKSYAYVVPSEAGHKR